jgi:hypothetical protein
MSEISLKVLGVLFGLYQSVDIYSAFKNGEVYDIVSRKSYQKKESPFVFYLVVAYESFFALVCYAVIFA